MFHTEDGYEMLNETEAATDHQYNQGEDDGEQLFKITSTHSPNVDSMLHNMYANILTKYYASQVNSEGHPCRNYKERAILVSHISFVFYSF
jgi:hypothetical protein